MTIQHEVQTLLTRLNVSPTLWRDGSLPVTSPVTGERIACVAVAPDPGQTIAGAQKAFLAWREVPAPRRGELVRLLGEELREERATLGRLVTLEAGKILSEGLGRYIEVRKELANFLLDRHGHG